MLVKSKAIEKGHPLLLCRDTAIIENKDFETAKGTEVL